MKTLKKLLCTALSLSLVLALAACGGLLHTGATGTNVNDVAVLLIRR